MKNDKNALKVLVACEESQAVTKAFRKLGHKAYSNDIQDCTGGKENWHIKGDALEAIASRPWDLVIAHPPCTFLTCAANKYYNVKKFGDKARERQANRLEAIKFVKAIAAADVPHIAIENPVGSYRQRGGSQTNISNHGSTDTAQPRRQASG